MDPNLCIDFIETAVDEGDYPAARIAFADLRAHLVGGGALPTKAKIIVLLRTLLDLVKLSEGTLPITRLPPTRTKTY